MYKAGIIKYVLEIIIIIFIICAYKKHFFTPGKNLFSHEDHKSKVDSACNQLPWAVEHGDADVVQFLFNFVSDEDKRQRAECQLPVAVKHGHAKLARFFFKYVGQEIKAEVALGQVSFCVNSGKADVLTVLIQITL